MNASELKQHEGQVLELRFSDGHCVQARLITVDYEDPAELIYEIIKVVSVGPPMWSDISPGTIASAPLGELGDFRFLGAGG